MAENVLGTLFGDIADAIRSKTGDSQSMKPAEFPAQIGNISTANVIDNVEIAVDFSNGDLTESLPEGYSAKSVTIFKPDTLIPENIAKDVNIAGVIGTHEGGGSENPYWDILPQTEITGFALNESLGGYAITVESSPFVPDEGATYTILWDGIAYQCVCKLDADTYVLGNLSIAYGEDGKDTGEPFAVGIAKEGNGVVILSTDAKESHTVRIIAKKKAYYTWAITPRVDGSEFGSSGYKLTVRHNMGVIPDIAIISFEALEVADGESATVGFGYATAEAVSSRFAAATGREIVATLVLSNGSIGSVRFNGNNGLETSGTFTIIGGIYSGTASTIEIIMTPVHINATYRLHLYGGLKLD